MDGTIKLKKKLLLQLRHREVWKEDYTKDFMSNQEIGTDFER